MERSGLILIFASFVVGSQSIVLADSIQTTRIDPSMNMKRPFGMQLPQRVTRHIDLDGLIPEEYKTELGAHETPVPYGGMINHLKATRPEFLNEKVLAENPDVWKQIILDYLLNMRQNGIGVKEVNGLSDGHYNDASPIRYLRVY